MATFADKTARPFALAAVAVLVGSVVALAFAVPASADLADTGAWIFPHERQSAVVGGTLGQFYYNTTSPDDWIADAFFADADTDGATVEVDLYNPTGGDMTSVNLWVAVSDFDYFTSIDFSGGASGDVSVAADDLGGGTPTTGADLPDYVYPAYYTSYGVGDLGAGSSGIVTVTLDITGDFGSGLVLRLDYTGLDANGNDISGPFDAGMSIYEWGDLPADEPSCPDDAGLKLGGTLSGKYDNGVIDIDATLELVPTFEYEASDVEATLTPGTGVSVLSAPNATVSQNVVSFSVSAVGGNAGNFSETEIHLRGAPWLLSGDTVTVDVDVSWDGCDGGGDLSAELSLVLDFDPAGRAVSASGWAGDMKDAMRTVGHGHHTPDYNLTAYGGFMQAIAMHSDVFTYGPWNGTDPAGGDDSGWVDLSNLTAVRGILQKDGRGNGNMKEAQQELLAVWLNVASGRVNLDSGLTVWKKHLGWDDDDDDDHHGGHGHSHSGGSSLPDDVQEVISGAESALADYIVAQDSSSHGHGHSHGDNQAAKSLWRSTLLCWLVNSGWLRVS